MLIVARTFDRMGLRQVKEFLDFRDLATSLRQH